MNPKQEIEFFMEKAFKFTLQDFAIFLFNKYPNKTASQVTLKELLECLDEFYNDKCKGFKD